MADKTQARVGPSASQLLRSLELKPLCDAADVQGMTPEQVAAVHAFLHEILAAFYRMRILVPENLVLTALNKRFERAAATTVSGQPR
jgi:hypothetical protein